MCHYIVPVEYGALGSSRNSLLVMLQHRHNKQTLMDETVKYRRTQLQYTEATATQTHL